METNWKDNIVLGRRETQSSGTIANKTGLNLFQEPVEQPLLGFKIAEENYKGKISTI